MKTQFRPGEIVRVAGTGREAVVEEISGPNETGSGWNLTIRLAPEGDRDSLAVVGEDELEPTGLAEDAGGERVPVGALPPAEEPRDCIELRFFTEITDGIDAARIAAEIEEDLVELLGGATITTEAERHWSEPYNYELAVTVVPSKAPVDAVRRLAKAGEGGWLACRDDGWRCDLWWSATRDPDAILIVPEVHAAELAFIPWSSPARRPEEERPLVAVTVPDDEDDYDDSDAEAGDEEA
jgi:hypothetical protein